MSPEELEAAKKSGYFNKNPNPDPNIKWDTDKKYWSQGDAEDYFGRAWKDSPDNAKVRMPAEKLPRWTAGQTGNAEVLDKATGTWNPVNEAFDNPYKGKWEKSDYGDIDVNAKLPDGTYLNIMFNLQTGDDGEEVVQVEFYRNNSQEVTGEGDAQRIFATVLDAIQKYIKKYKPQRLSFSASKAVDMDADDVEYFNPESRAKLYDRLVQRYSKALGYRAFRADNGDIVIYELSRLGQGVAENFHDGKNPGRKGLAKRMGVNTKASVSDLRKTAKNSSGEKQRMAHWLANMKSGRNKNK
jgi:hypothetical protein